MIIYIAGPMKGKADYKTEFDTAEAYLTAKGHIVLNPAKLPPGLGEHSYMPICLAMVNAADAILLLPGSKDSFGARLEEEFAGYQGKTIYNGLDSIAKW